MLYYRQHYMAAATVFVYGPETTRLAEMHPKYRSTRLVEGALSWATGASAQSLKSFELNSVKYECKKIFQGKLNLESLIRFNFGLNREDWWSQKRRDFNLKCWKRMQRLQPRGSNINDPLDSF